MVRIAAVGEVMVELSPFPTQENDKQLLSLSFAGDTYNTSVYLARLGLHTAYVTNLGNDHYSQQIIHNMSSENIHTDMVQQFSGRSPGLYTIRNTENGEREFFYWRNEAPAKQLFSTAESAESLFETLREYDWVYLSGITLAIITPQARENLFAILKKLRSEKTIVVFDSNYRPRLWNDKKCAQETMLAMMQHTDIALLTLDDESQLWGDETISGCKQRYDHCHLREIILKRGAQDTVIINEGAQSTIPVPPVLDVIDTTGAGDSFNAGYLAARLQGADAEDAVRAGNRCASIIIRHRGAVIPKNIFIQEWKNNF